MSRALWITGIALALAACGSDSSSSGAAGPDAQAPMPARFGVVIAEEEIDSEINEMIAEVVAVFGRYETPVDAASVTGIYRRAADSCVISVENDGANRVDNILSGPAFSAISAGSTLAINGADGSALVATQITAGQPELFYRVEPEPRFPLSSGLVIEIPGQDFPALSASLPDVTALTGFLPASSRSSTVITADTQFSWQAGNDSNARVLIRSDIANFASLQAPDGVTCDSIDDEGFCQLSPLDFYCDVQDDGFFEFPDEIKTALGNDYRNQGEFIAVRRAIETVPQDDALLVLVRQRDAD